MHTEDSVTFLVRNIRIPFTEPAEAGEKKAGEALVRALGRSNTPAVTEIRLYKRSLDARKKPDILFVCAYLVTARCKRRAACDALTGNPDVSVFEEEPFEIPHGSETMDGRPVIVGFGPAGMFAALLLAEEGLRPVILERGDDVEARVAAVSSFYRTKILDPDSNIQFGAGGAGTFSDGKLVTRIGDPKCGYILRRYAEFGAGEEILTKAKPHVGTDVLTRVVSAIRDHLETLGCEFHFRTTMKRILWRENARGERKAYGVLTDKGEIPCGCVILALGHSARDTHTALFEDGMTVLPKPFSVGVRIEHLQSDINAASYGNAAKYTEACGAVGKDILLPPAEYTVSMKDRTAKDGMEPRGVYSFCMCPGGEVVAAASEEGGVVVNGMSRSKRNGNNANAALAVSVRTEDYGNTPLGGIAFQRSLERAAFRLAGGTYAAPVQTVGDFLSGKCGTKPGRVKPSYMNGFVTESDLSEILPPYVTEMLRAGIPFFDRQLPGFASPDAILSGVETRTSSPVRLLREETCLAKGYENVYPVGEGAGYAGGITSASADGLNAALKILGRYRVG